MMIATADSTNQRGMALLVVLWTLSLLSLMALAFAQNAWLERHRVRNLIDAAAAQSILQAGLSFAVTSLLHSRNGRAWAHDGTPYHMKFAGSDVTISLQDANGCLNINSATAADIQALLGTIGVGNDIAQSLAAAIVDWRDSDQLRSPNGAELPEYVNAGSLERPANRSFLSTAELNGVLGMTPEIADRLLPLVSIFPAGPEINPVTAPEQVLRADRSIPAEEITAILTRRAARPPATPFGTADALSSTTFDAQPRTATQADLAETPEAPVYMVAISVVTSAGAKARARAEIWITQDPKEPYHILNWHLDRQSAVAPAATP